MLRKLILIFNILMIRSSVAMLLTHFKCRGGVYPRSEIVRFPVPEEKVSWDVKFCEYHPPTYTSPSLLGKPYADPEIGDPLFKPTWHSRDGSISRESYSGQYRIEDGYPLNPVGRTGIRGRGILGRWGPNHAADPVVTRWKRLDNGIIDTDAIRNRPILQVVLIKRGDTGEWALPGGMVDPGEKVTTTAIREFQEEAVNSLVMSDDEKEAWQEKFKHFFSEGEIIYKGYVDDRRNTDNAWMETVAYNFHDDNGSIVGSMNLNAGDDAVGVQWVDITPDLRLYANHEYIVKQVLKRRQLTYS